MILTLSNLYPRPDQPQRGMYNAQLFRAMAEVGRSQLLLQEIGKSELNSSEFPVQGSVGPRSPCDILNLCLVPEWRVWRWPAIRRWREPDPALLPTHYVPVFYLPWIGRNFSWRTYGWCLAPWLPRLRGGEALLVAWLYPDGVTASHFGKKAGIPVWILVQGSDTFHLDNLYRRRVILQACMQARGIICVCESLADRLRKHGVDPLRIRVVPNGVDTRQFRYRPAHEARRALSGAQQP